MTTFNDLNPDARERLLKIADLARDMEPEDRATARTTFGQLAQTLALWGTDDVIPAAMMLGLLMELVMIAERDERRTAEVV